MVILICLEKILLFKENDLMRNNTTIFDIFQTLLTKEEVITVCEALGYKDTSRKFTVYDLFQFFIAAATNDVIAQLEEYLSYQKIY